MHLEVKKATGATGYLMKVPVISDGEFVRDADGEVTFKSVFRIYDGKKNFKDYDINVYDLKIQIVDEHCVLTHVPHGNFVESVFYNKDLPPANQN